MNLRIETTAEADIEAAMEWYEDRRVGLGFEFLVAFREATRKITETPLAFSKYELLPNTRDFRRYRLRRFPYIVIFQIRPDEIVVFAVSHAHRRPNFWLPK